MKKSSEAWNRSSDEFDTVESLMECHRVLGARRSFQGYTGLCDESYGIHLVWTNPGASLDLYEQLFFALHASNWFPRPLGIVLWSVLHVLLVVGDSFFPDSVRYHRPDTSISVEHHSNMFPSVSYGCCRVATSMFT
jgi:hypothetical protein